MKLTVPHLPHFDWKRLKQRALAVPLWKWGVGAAVGGLLLVIVFRKGIGQMIGGAWNSALDAAFTAALEAAGNPYAPIILQVAQEESVSPLLIYGLGMNETRWGRGGGYKNNAGDWTMRTGHWLREPRVTIVDSAPEGWSYPKDDNGVIVAGPYVIPDDGMGWGRDLLQVDYPNYLKNPFRLGDALEAVRAGVRIYKAYRAQLAQSLLVPGSTWTEADVDSAATAAYNRGVSGVLHNIDAGLDVDVGTTGYKAGVEGSGYAARAENTMQALMAKLA